MAKDKSPDQAVTASIYDELQARGLTLLAYGLVRGRVKQLLQDMGDPAQVELLALWLAQRAGEKFGVTYSLNQRSLALARVALDVPDGAWRWALWLWKLPPGRYRDSVDYWLGRWRDGLDVYDDRMVTEAQEMLQRLRDAEAPMESITW